MNVVKGAQQDHLVDQDLLEVLEPLALLDHQDCLEDLDHWDHQDLQVT